MATTAPEAQPTALRPLFIWEGEIRDGKKRLSPNRKRSGNRVAFLGADRERAGEWTAAGRSDRPQGRAGPGVGGEVRRQQGLDRRRWRVFRRPPRAARALAVRRHAAR